GKLIGVIIDILEDMALDIEDLGENVMEFSDDEVTCFLPYMDEDDVFELAKIAIKKGDGVTCFLPYMDEDDVFELAKIMYNRGEAIKELLPYMDDDDASSFVKEKL
ncbi:MAG: hypothetical protein IKC74_02530, partial [Clostridia bacterium]|nr:hypothetical protein [Clostridia bacterium]